MREIKFRVWNKSIYPDLLESTIVSLDNTGWININKSTNGGIDQYTGLKDKNGTEIYEGDVLKHPEYGTCEVVYRFGSFGIAAKTSSWISTGFHSFSTRSADYEHCEVIGNIYENSNLLSQDK